VLRAEAWRGCGLPTDPARLAVLMGVPRADVDRVWAVVGAQFVERDGRYVLPFLEAQREKHQALRDRNAENGKHGGRPPKPDKPTGKPTENPDETQWVSDGFPKVNPDESSSTFSLPVVEESSVGAHAHEADATVRPDRPGELPRDVVTGVVVGDIAHAAVLFTAAVNRGLRETHGEQPHPLRHNAQHAYAEKLLAAGVDEAWARDWLYHRARSNTRADNQPGSLAFFVTWCIKAWRKRVAEEASKQHADALVVGADPEPRAQPAQPGTGVVPFAPPAPRPTRTDRVVERSLQGSLSAIARYKGRTA
jgi:hypothetical protein